MASFGVHSEVGKLRTVIVHRPDLSLKRLTPDNHDELLFDDVLWVERAQWEHDQFVARMRERGVEVLYVQDLLGEALAASEEARQRLIAVVAAEAVVGPEPGRGRSAPACTRLPPDALARHLIGGLTVAESGLDLGKLAKTSAHRRRPSTTRACSSCRPCPTRCSPATRRAGSTAASRSIPCTGPRVVARPTTWRAIYRAHPQVPGRGLRVLVSGARRRREVQGRGLRPGLAGGWRRRDHRQRDGRHRHVRAHVRTDDRAHRQGPLCQGGRGAGHRRGHDEGPRPHAPRHGVHPARPRQGHSLSEGRRGDPLDQSAAGHQARARSTSARTRTSSRPSRTRWASRSSTSSRPAATPTSRRASSGTMATTSSPSNPAWSSPTSATRSRSRRCARRESRSSRSRASSWARAAVVGIA